MRKDFKRAKVHVISKLIRHATNLREKRYVLHLLQCTGFNTELSENCACQNIAVCISCKCLVYRGSDAQKEKNARRADKLIQEIHLLKVCGKFARTNERFLP